MENYKHSDYAANKYASGIVYRFADETVEVTLADYLRDNPDKSESDFAEIKALSDGIYEELARNMNRQTYKNVSFHGLAETEAFASPSPDNILFDQPEQTAKKFQQRQLAKHALNTLTDVQRRRYILHAAKGLSTWKIAKKEGVSQRSVMECLKAATKKINNNFSKVPKTPSQNA